MCGPCPCADFDAIFKLPAPDGGFYSLGIYWGCDHCHMPAGVRVNKHTAEDAKSWRVPELPEPDFEHWLGEVLIPVFDPDKLAEEIREKLEPFEERLYKARMYRIADVLNTTLSETTLLTLIRDHQDRVREKARKDGR